ncbi:MAG: site-specific DNA-methyltransferase, partial [bacterium]
MGEKGLSNFKKEITTVWTFPKRGEWKTHNSKYRGNFAPQIPRNL